MSDTTSSSSREAIRVTLNGAYDWRTWKRAFWMKASLLGLWEHIDPEVENPPAFLPRPARPDKSLIEEAKRAGTSGEERSAAIDAACEKISSLWELYRIEDDLYEDERENIRKLELWVYVTVASHIYKKHCSPDTDLRVWYSNLLKDFDADALHVAKTRAIHAWNDFFYAAPRVPKDPMKWVDEFVDVMNEAQNAELPLTTCPLVWLIPLRQLTEPFLGSSIRTWMVQFRKEITDNSLSFLLIANLMSQHISYQEAAKNKGWGGRAEGSPTRGRGRGRGSRRGERGRPKNKT